MGCQSKKIGWQKASLFSLSDTPFFEFLSARTLFISPGRRNAICTVRTARLTTMGSVKIETLRPGLFM